MAQRIADLTEQISDYVAKQRANATDLENRETPTGAQAKANAALAEAKNYTDAEVDAAVKAGAVQVVGDYDPARAYAQLEAVFHPGTGATWYANTATVAGEEPGVSPKWSRYNEGITKATADADYEPVIRIAIERYGGGTGKTAAENTQAYADIAAAFAGQVKVGLGSGTYNFSPLTMLTDKKIEGRGYQTVIRFTGLLNTDHCFYLPGRFRSGVSNCRVQVDTTFTGDVFHLLAGAVGICSQNHFDVWVDTPGGNADPDPNNYGAYTAFRLKGAGVWDNDFNYCTANNCGNGAVLEASAANDWITFNRFDHFYCRTFADTAIELIEASGASVICNTFVAPNILDWDRHNATVRTGIKVAGRGNNFEDVAYFGDGTNGTFYALDLEDTGQHSYGNLITGSIEGLIRREENLVNHSVDLMNIKKKRNSSDVQSGATPNGRIRTTQSTNLLPHSEFRSDTAHGWTLSGLTATIEPSTGGMTREQVRLVKTSAAGSVADFIFTLNPALLPTLKGRWATFSAAVETSVSTVEVVMNDGVTARRGMRSTGDGGPEVLTVQMRPATTATTLNVRVRFTTDAPINTEAILRWINATYGFSGPQVPIPPLRDRAYVRVADDAKVFTSGEMAAGLGSPTRTTVHSHLSGMALDPDVIESVTMNHVTPAEWATCKVTAWLYSATAGDAVVHATYFLNRADGLAASAFTGGPNKTVTFAANTYRKVELVTGLSVIPGRLQSFAVERLATNAADTLAADILVLSVEVQRAT